MSNIPFETVADDEIYAGEIRDIQLLADPDGSEESACVLHFPDGSQLEVWPDGHLEGTLPSGQLAAFSLESAIDKAMEEAIVIIEK